MRINRMIYRCVLLSMQVVGVREEDAEEEEGITLSNKQQ